MGLPDPRFTHLHVHSHHTLLGGTASVAELATRAAADGLGSLALTDTNALYGAVAFARACQDAGVRPITGMAVTVALPEDLGAPARDAHAPGLLVLLATGPAGYRSLCRLSSQVQGGPDRETLAARGFGLDDLRAHRDGLICLGGGRVGRAERLLRAGDLSAAREYAGRLAGIYGEDAYLSLELHRPEDLAVGGEIAALGKALGLPSVAVQPVYCLSPQDVDRLRLLAAIDLNCPLEAVPAEAVPGRGDPGVALHWLGPVEMAARFAPFPRALAHAAEISSRCEPALPQGRTIFPAIALPEGRTADQALRELALVGLAERCGPDPAPVARERLQRELAAIARHGYAPLFLVVADVVRFARQADIPVSTRGSVANSLVAY
jgi:DNA polymerase-3 subunit alpha